MTPYRDIYKLPRLKDHIKNKLMIEFIEQAIDDYYNGFIGKIKHWDSFYDNGWKIKYENEPYTIEEFCESLFVGGHFQNYDINDNHYFYRYLNILLNALPEDHNEVLNYMSKSNDEALRGNIIAFIRYRKQMDEIERMLI